MGKRKRRGDNNKAAAAPSDSIVHAAQVDLFSELRPSDLAKSSETQSEAPIMDALDSSLKRPLGHLSALHQNHGSSQTILLRHSYPPFGRHYSRRSSSNHSGASPKWNASPVYDAKLPFEMESKDLFHFHYRGSTDGALQKPNRIRSSLLARNAIRGDVRKMECAICQKRMKKNPVMSENSISSTDLSVVAVLVCGHAYHADCLEEKTSDEYQQDPPCPLCENQTS